MVEGNVIGLFIYIVIVGIGYFFGVIDNIVYDGDV